MKQFQIFIRTSKVVLTNAEISTSLLEISMRHATSPGYLFGRGAPKCNNESDFHFVIRGIVAAFVAYRILENGDSILPDGYWKKTVSDESVNEKRKKVGQALNACAGSTVFAKTRHYDFVRDFKDSNLMELFPDLEKLNVAEIAPNICTTIRETLAEIHPHVENLAKCLIKKSSSKFSWATESKFIVDRLSQYIYCLIHRTDIQKTLKDHDVISAFAMSDSAEESIRAHYSYDSPDKGGRHEWKTTLRLVEYFTKEKKVNGMRNRARNMILEGAPGTGKSFAIQDFTDNSTSVIRTTFHEDYSHSDFIGRVRPVPVEGSLIRFEWQPGPFIKAYISAIQNVEVNTYLIIEELSRGRPAQIFGNIFALLDRGRDGSSKYPESIPDPALHAYLRRELGEKFDERMRLPANLYIWATMNIQDQTTSNIDSAFLRRWHVKSVPVDLSKVSGTFNMGTDNLVKVELKKVISGFNQMIMNGDNFINKLEIGQYYIRFDEIDDSNDEEKRELVFSRLLGHLRSLGGSDQQIYDVFFQLFKEFDSNDIIFSETSASGSLSRLSQLFIYLDVESQNVS